MAAHSCVLPGKFYGQRSWAGYSPGGCKELDTTEHVCSRKWFSDLRTPLLLCALERDLPETPLGRALTVWVCMCRLTWSSLGADVATLSFTKMFLNTEGCWLCNLWAALVVSEGWLDFNWPVQWKFLKHCYIWTVRTQVASIVYKIFSQASFHLIFMINLWAGAKHLWKKKLRLRKVR